MNGLLTVIYLYFIWLWYCYQNGLPICFFILKNNI